MDGDEAGDHRGVSLEGQQSAERQGGAGTAIRKAKVRTPPPVEMSRAERDYAGRLSGQVSRGEIFGWRFEAIKLRLSIRCWYTPDFYVVGNDNLIELHEVKQRWSSGKVGMKDDAAVKLKVAAKDYREFRFVLAIKSKDGWELKEVQIP